MAGQHPGRGASHDPGSEPTVDLSAGEPDHEPTLIDFDSYGPTGGRRGSAQRTSTESAHSGGAPVASGRRGSAQRTSTESAHSGGAPVASRTGRRRRRGIVALIVITLLVALIGTGLGFAERQARITATDRAKVALSNSLGGPVDVQIGDRFVLLALARNTFDRVTGSAPQLELQGNGQRVKVTDVTFEGYGISQVIGQSPISISSLKATGVVSYAEVSRITGVSIKDGSGGRVLVDQKVNVLGASMTVEVSAVPGVDPGTSKLTLTDPKAEVGGVPIPASILNPLLKRLSERSTLPSVQGLRYEKLTATGGGFSLDLSGTNVVVPR